MCYAAMTKGTTALRTALLVAARRLDVYDELIAEMEQSQAAALGRSQAGHAAPADRGLPLDRRNGRDREHL